MGDTVIVETPVDEVVSIVTAGPQGPSGSEAATLTTTGDLLYRDALANDRLPIGSEGQVLKVSSGLPAWGNESGAVTSVNGETGAVVLDAADVGAATSAQGSLADSAVQPGDIATVATSGDYDDLTNKPSTFTPSTHASSHAVGQADFLAPSDIGAQSIFENIAVGPISADTTLTASRAARYNILSFTGTALNITLPTTNLLAGDVAIISSPALTPSGSLVIRRLNADTSYTTLATITKSIGSNGETFRFYTVGTASSDWRLDIIPNHSSAHASNGPDALSLAASQITSGTLTHERGGLEADVSAYDGLLKISGGSTSAVTLSSAGEALLDDADAAAQRTTLGLGAVASSNSYTDLDNQPSIPSALNDLSNVSAAAPNDNDVLVYDNATSTWVAEAPAAGGIAGSTGSTDNAILRADGTGGSTAQAADILIDDATTSTQNNVAIVNNHSETDSALVLTPKGTGAFIVGPKPDGTSTGGNARGANAVDIQAGDRSSAGEVASGARSVAIGTRCAATGSNAISIGRDSRANQDSVGVGRNALGNGFRSVAIGLNTSCSNNATMAVGRECSASGNEAISIGKACNASTGTAIAIGQNCNASAVYAVALGALQTANLRSQFATRTFNAIYWGGQTTDATPTILNLDDTATNRFTIAANTALAVDVLLVARRSDTADKWLVARRFLGIRRDGSNNTSLIGSVQTLGTDQSDGSPTWSFTLTADDTNEALQLEVTGAASETVQWRATAFYRVV